MPLGIVSDNEFNDEITNSSLDRIHENFNKSIPLINPTNDIDNEPRVSEVEIIEMPKVGRIPEVVNVPQSLRKLLAETHAVEGLEAAKEFANEFGGLSQPTLSTYGNGEVSRGRNNRQDNEILDFINNRKTKISKRALGKLTMVLNHIDDSKLVDLGALELSSVAKNMSVVAKQMEPTVRDEEKKEPVQIIMYAPQVRNETHYQTVTAKDNY